MSFFGPSPFISIGPDLSTASALARSASDRDLAANAAEGGSNGGAGVVLAITLASSEGADSFLMGGRSAAAGRMLVRMPAFIVRSAAGVELDVGVAEATPGGVPQARFTVASASNT